ncbi:uncharacterized protein LOC144772799 [Lissotriton helveticus]
MSSTTTEHRLCLSSPRPFVKNPTAIRRERTCEQIEGAPRELVTDNRIHFTAIKMGTFGFRTYLGALSINLDYRGPRGKRSQTRNCMHLRVTSTGSTLLFYLWGTWYSQCFKDFLFIKLDILSTAIIALTNGIIIFEP